MVRISLGGREVFSTILQIVIRMKRWRRVKVAFALRHSCDMFLDLDRMRRLGKTPAICNLKSNLKTPSALRMGLES
jgi:hypothetical protein